MAFAMEFIATVPSFFADELRDQQVNNSAFRFLVFAMASVNLIHLSVTDANCEIGCISRKRNDGEDRYMHTPKPAKTQKIRFLKKLCKFY